MINSPMKTIHLTYYALLREERGVPKETLETAAVTAQELYGELKLKYHFRLSTDSLKVSINDAFTSWKTQIRTGDHVVFIPPISGG